MLDRTPKTLNFRRYHAVIVGPLISRKLLELESRNGRHLSTGPSTPFRYENISARERAGGAAPRSVNIGPLISWKLYYS